MTIASAFNEIAVAQGGTANTSGTIAGAIDALNDALAGSDQAAASTIEGAVRLLGSHISAGGGGGGGEAQTATLLVLEYDSSTQEAMPNNPGTIRYSGTYDIIEPSGEYTDEYGTYRKYDIAAGTNVLYFPPSGYAAIDRYLSVYATEDDFANESNRILGGTDGAFPVFGFSFFAPYLSSGGN